MIVAPALAKSSVRNRAGDAAATDIALLGPIGADGVTAESFLAQLKQIDGPIRLAVNSIGGDFFQGATIADAIRRRGGVTARVHLAASIASAIVVSADRVLMAADGFVVIHSPYTTITGRAEDLDRMATALRKLTATLIDIYRRRTGQSEAVVSRWLADETWFDSKEAVAARLADAVDDQRANVAASVDLTCFRNVPAAVSRSITAAAWDRVINQQSGGVPLRRPGPAGGSPALLTRPAT